MSAPFGITLYLGKLALDPPNGNTYCAKLYNAFIDVIETRKMNPALINTIHVIHVDKQVRGGRVICVDKDTNEQLAGVEKTPLVVDATGTRHSPGSNSMIQLMLWMNYCGVRTLLSGYNKVNGPAIDGRVKANFSAFKSSMSAHRAALKPAGTSRVRVQPVAASRREEPRRPVASSRRDYDDMDVGIDDRRGRDPGDTGRRDYRGGRASTGVSGSARRYEEEDEYSYLHVPIFDGPEHGNEPSKDGAGPAKVSSGGMGGGGGGGFGGGKDFDISGVMSRREAFTSRY